MRHDILDALRPKLPVHVTNITEAASEACALGSLLESAHAFAIGDGWHTSVSLRECWLSFVRRGHRQKMQFRVALFPEMTAEQVKTGWRAEIERWGAAGPMGRIPLVEASKVNGIWQTTFNPGAC